MEKAEKLLALLVSLSIFILVLIVANYPYNESKAQDVADQALANSSLGSAANLPLTTPSDKPEPLIIEPGPITTVAHQAYEADDKDLQNPEYPTGCEGVSAAVMLRMNGVDVTNDTFMDALPKGGAEDFVHAFWGDPATHAGFACMAPAITDTCKKLVPLSKAPLDLTGTNLADLPAPCVIWVTMYFTDPVETEYEQEGYKLFYNTHCVVLLSCDEAQAHVWDPLQGYQDVAFSQLNQIYMTLGKQAVYIAERGYKENGEMMDERKEEYEALMQQVEDGAYNGDGPEDVAPVVVNEEEGETDGE